jgi:hypothetical protein
MRGPRSSRRCSASRITGTPTSIPLSGIADGAIVPHSFLYCGNAECHIDLADAPFSIIETCTPCPSNPGCVNRFGDLNIGGVIKDG